MYNHILSPTACLGYSGRWSFRGNQLIYFLFLQRPEFYFKKMFFVPNAKLHTEEKEIAKKKTSRRKYFLVLMELSDPQRDCTS